MLIFDCSFLFLFNNFLLGSIAFLGVQRQGLFNPTTSFLGLRESLKRIIHEAIDRKKDMFTGKRQ
jgi:hypothetical protein